MRGLFVTGTDTGVGKTIIATALARLLTARGISVRARKPVESGCERRDGRLHPADATALCAAAGGHEPVEAVCPYPLKAAISPERAAQLAGRAIMLHDLERACIAGADESCFLLIEGAGGFLSPLASDGLVADLAGRLRLPVVLVVADRLGCLSHALLTVEAIRSRALALGGVILNQVEPRHERTMDNAADLAKWLQLPVIDVPHAPANGGAAIDAALAAFAASL